MVASTSPAAAASVGQLAAGIGCGTHRLARRWSYSTTMTLPPPRTLCTRRDRTPVASRTKCNALAARSPSSGRLTPGSSNGTREVGFDGNDPGLTNGRKIAERVNRVRIGVDCIDGAAGTEEFGQREREGAAPGAEVGPEACAVSDRVAEQIDRFLILHATPR